MLESPLSNDLVQSIIAIVGLSIAGFVALYFIAIALSIVLRLLWWLRGFILGTAVALYLDLEMLGIVIVALIGGLLVFLLSSQWRNGRSHSFSQPATSKSSSSSSEWWPWSDISTDHSAHADSNVPTINPGTGLPMMNNSIDVAGNTFGSSGYDTSFGDHSIGMDNLHDGF